MKALSRHVQPEITEARLTRLWGNVHERLGQRQPRRYGLLLGGLGAVTAAAAIWLHVARSQSEVAAPSAFEQAAFETRSDASRVALKDGSTIELAPETRVEVVESQKRSVRLALRKGRVTCDVAKDEARPFVVVAGKIEVHVVGTKFTVDTSDVPRGERVEVSVERGVVEVRGTRGGSVRLTAGQSLREEPEPPRDVALPPAPATTSPPPVTSTTPAPSASAESARELLDQANWARRNGQVREAAAAYETLLKRFPGDGRAGLAAFELGRLRMDSLKDLAGAAQALERAVALAPGSAFREDALARLTQAYAGLGRNAECARAKERYLRGYPNGVHKDAVSARCVAPAQ